MVYTVKNLWKFFVVYNWSKKRTKELSVRVALKKEYSKYTLVRVLKLEFELSLWTKHLYLCFAYKLN